MYLHGRVADNNGESMDASSRGLFMALSFFFGCRLDLISRQTPLREENSARRCLGLGAQF
jgi:hypothetical protein